MADLISTLKQAGFTGNALRTAYAIAMRESGGRPDAYNPNRSTGDDSFGLFQINMLGNLGPARRKQYGLKSNEQLLDPATNAKVAYRMSKGGTDFGAWGLGPNAYRSGAGFDTIKKWYDQFPQGGTAPIRSQGLGGRAGRGAPSRTPAGTSVSRAQFFSQAVREGRWGVGSSLSQTASLTREFNRTYGNQEIPGSGGLKYPKVQGRVDPEAAPLVQEAYRWLGTPYSWAGGGSGGPSEGVGRGKGTVGFDCSGLIQYLYAKQGKSVPRVTYDQWRSGQAVGQGELQPGDAVFFRMGDRGPEHVGLYSGNGKFIHAPKTGDVVKVSSLNEDYYRRNYVGARRW